MKHLFTDIFFAFSLSYIKGSLSKFKSKDIKWKIQVVFELACIISMG